MYRKPLLALAAGFVLASVLFVPLAQSADDPTKAVEKELLKLSKAFETGDTAALKSLMTDDKLAITPYYEAPQNKAEQIASLADFKATEYVVGKFQSSALGNDVVLVTFPVTMKGTYKGKPLPTKLYAASLWVHRDGKWRERFYQETVARN